MAFGNKVDLKVTGANGEVVFESRGLRVDFDVVEIFGFGRARIDVFNLGAKQIAQVTGGTRYVTLRVTQHDGPTQTLIQNYYVSNAYEQTKVPNSVTSLFCYSKVRRDFLEKNIGIVVLAPALRNCITQAIRAGNLRADPTVTKKPFDGKVIYRHFPEGMIDKVPLTGTRPWTGSIEGWFTKLSKEYSFKYFTEENNLVFMYQPVAENLKLTSLVDADPDVQLDANNLESNPIIGPANLQIASNLDTRIKPGAVLDTSKLVTAAPNADDITLQVAEGFIEKAVSGFTKYQTINVRHRGSNYTKQWQTQATGTSPTVGIDMPTIGWMKPNE